MLKPSYAELMDVMNKDNETGDDITSRYTVVIAAAKRARQLIEGDKPMVEAEDLEDKPLSIAVRELREGKIKVVPEGMGTVLHIEKDNLQEEIKSELEQAAENAELQEDMNDEDSLITDEDFMEEDFSEEELKDLDTLDFSEDEEE
ncbi:MAG: DNA-directed RNA polymerase subunit omega [Clostridiales bacterium]|nr:DNA-directed RNA polymerase subunit omega [Clostridiales bacterium]